MGLYRQGEKTKHPKRETRSRLANYLLSCWPARLWPARPIRTGPAADMDPDTPGSETMVLLKSWPARPKITENLSGQGLPSSRQLLQG